MKRLLPLLLLLALASSLSALRYPFINYRSSDGLPQSTVTALLQDRDGFLWVGTQAGLGRFDGDSFQPFTQRQGLAGNYITGLALDRKGDVWVASQDGLNRIRSGRIEPWPLADSFVRAIAFSPLDDALWVLTDRSLFTVRGERTLGCSLFADPGRLRGLAAGASGMAFFSTETVTLLRGGQLRAHPSPGPVNFVKEVDGRLFVGCRSGLFVLTPFGEFRKYAELPEPLADASDLLVDGAGDLWIGSRGGLFRKNLQTGAGEVLTSANGLIYDRVLHLLLDREGNVFIGTSLGLSQLSRHRFRLYGPEDGLPSTHVWDILEDEGGLLLGCEDGLAEMRGGIVRPLAVNARLKGHSLRAVVRLQPGRYLLGCADGEIFEWDRRQRLRSLTSGVPVLHAVRASDGGAWFATSRGLLNYDGGAFRWFHAGLGDAIVWNVAELEPGSLLVGTRRGLQLFRDGRFVASDWERRVGHATVNDIRVVGADEVLVACEAKGVLWLKGNSQRRLTREQGLLHDDAWSVLLDDHGNVWTNTTRALERLAADGSLAHFNRETGLFGDEGCVHSALKAANGSLYFGIPPGLVEVPLPAGVGPSVRPALVIAPPLVQGSAAAPVSKPLRHDQNTVEFRYVCPSLSRESPVQYRTRLFPFDGDWSLPGRQTAVRYTNLPPGTYTFSVLANNGGGDASWFGSEQRVVFTIARPFWKRWWFLALEALLALSLLALLVNARFRVLNRQKRRLEEVVQARTNEIAEKNRELAQLSITDPLTGLKNRRYLDETIREDMSILQRERHNVRQELKPFDEKASSLGVFMIDVDFFKRVNDAYGHEAGDAVIVEIARRLQAMMRQSDSVARWGGEEFLIITRQSRRCDAYPLAERIRQTIEGDAFPVAAEARIKKTISIGYCHYPFFSGEEEKLSWQQVVAMADTALYLAKHNGRNLVIGAEPGPEPFPGPGQELLADLGAAVKHGHVRLVCRKPVRIPAHP